MEKRVVLFFLCLLEGLDMIVHTQHTTTSKSMNIDLLLLVVFMINYYY